MHTPPHILLAAVAGDALGTAFDGFSKGHIRSHFKEMRGYVDPGPALKDKDGQWRKPGLYSSISQFMLILSLACFRRGPCSGTFIRSIAASPDVTGHEYGMFRHPDAIEREFIRGAKTARETPDAPSYPTARILTALTPLSFRENSPMEHMSDVIRITSLFTRDLSTMAASLVYSLLIKSLAEDNDRDPLIQSIEAASAVMKFIEAGSAVVFSLSVNPASLSQMIIEFYGVMSATAVAGSLPEAEKIICSTVNKLRKTPVTRATVNDPIAIFPYALSLCKFHRNDPSLLFQAAAEGGSSAALTSITGVLGACVSGKDVVPESLVQGLVNRKRIILLTNARPSDAAQAGFLEEFILSEASLTAKELEETKARSKHAGAKKKSRPRSKKDKERELSRHVVENWTKIDKARWKRERKQTDKREES